MTATSYVGVLEISHDNFEVRKVTTAAFGLLARTVYTGSTTLAHAEEQARIYAESHEYPYVGQLKADGFNPLNA